MFEDHGLAQLLLFWEGKDALGKLKELRIGLWLSSMLMAVQMHGREGGSGAEVDIRPWADLIPCCLTSVGHPLLKRVTCSMSAGLTQAAEAWQQSAEHSLQSMKPHPLCSSLISAWMLGTPHMAGRAVLKRRHM